MLANILYFLFLVTPGVFLLLASTLYNEWWKNTIDKTNVQFLKENLDMLSHVVGSVLIALGMILLTLNLGGSFNNEKLNSLRVDLVAMINCHLIPPNQDFINKIEKDYDFGLNVYGINKISLQKYKIFNFHLGSLKNQRGSFIFFYKFLYNWKSIDLTFHEVNEKYDVGKIYNRRKIELGSKTNATDICFLYLSNLDCH